MGIWLPKLEGLPGAPGLPLWDPGESEDLFPVECEFVDRELVEGVLWD
jgi:hypothetical protein